jgi:cAMP-dependent protein kinase regulator
MSVPRAAVSAEVYGAFNRKEDFKARVIKKTEEQTQKIKARILQSFLFNGLESSDLEIVINAMDEKEYQYIIKINRVTK